MYEWLIADHNLELNSNLCNFHLRSSLAVAGEALEHIFPGIKSKGLKKLLYSIAFIVFIFCALNLL